MRRTISTFARAAVMRSTRLALLPVMQAPVMMNYRSALVQPRRFASDAALAEATRRELDDELSRTGKPEQPAPPAGWEVIHTPGKCIFELKKNYEDEKITVSYCPSPEGDTVNHHELLVLIVRDGKCMQIDLSVEEGELVLDNICYYNDAKVALEDTAEADARRKELYPGPKVGELDDGLLDTFIQYLNKRGITDELGEFITLYSFWAEQQEYENWLSSINKFVS